MAVKDNNVLDGSVFLEDLRLLRSQKGRYISPSFCVKLKNISYKINEAITHKNFGAKIAKANKRQRPEKISDDMVDLCLECMEIYLQKISAPGCFVNIREDSQTLQILADISSDLCSLATYINFTLD